jgi:hypothetical protein
MKLLKENVPTLDIGLSNNLLDISLKFQATKVKINKQNYMKLKHFFTAMTIFNKTKGNLQIGYT